MRLSKRIYALANNVIDGHSIADIGTDHGYVPMLLMKEGRSPHVIMSDISEGSLAKAKETFAAVHLDDRVSESDFRIGDGLQTIEAGEVDEIIIAGLGGHTIKSILADDEQKSRSFGRLILQPRKHSGTLRYYLYTHGWDIESEKSCGRGKVRLRDHHSRTVRIYAEGSSVS
jgi:tRNA (adenine22-N1)-methyltransferase